MNLDAIRELIALMKENQLDEIDWESEGEHIRLKAAGAAPVYVQQPAPMAAAPLALPPAAPGAPAATSAAAPEPPAAPDPGFVIKSPIVGVYYASPGPDKPAFVQPGDAIEAETVICIIEAMKVMNEIKAETTGTLRKILVENNQSVEYGQPMFIIDPPAK